jgi:hypothetical protein
MTFVNSPNNWLEGRAEKFLAILLIVGQKSFYVWFYYSAQPQLAGQVDLQVITEPALQRSVSVLLGIRTAALSPPICVVSLLVSPRRRVSSAKDVTSKGAESPSAAQAAASVLVSPGAPCNVNDSSGSNGGILKLVACSPMQPPYEKRLD